MRPRARPMTKLKVLEPRRKELELCAYCPKLSRSACPVSNAEPRETLTPWGKMSTAYFAARGDVPLTKSFAAPAWACTGCFACRESCEHQNDVAGTLLAARDAFVRAGVAPAKAQMRISRFAAMRERHRAGVRSLATAPGVDAGARTALLVGCTYLHAAPSEAEDARAAAAALSHEGRVALLESCCGLPLLHAGDAAGFRRQAETLAAEVRGKDGVLVADAGCAHALRVRYAEHGVRLDAPVTILVERAARSLDRLRTLGFEGTVRYHDPCHLGRGLGVYEAPRAVLTRILGRAPDEFDARRERAECSGGGGGLPITMPETAKAIAAARVASHGASHGERGRIVTACAASLVRMRRAGAHVDDLTTWIARALR